MSTPIPGNEISDMEDHMTHVTTATIYHTLGTKLPRVSIILKKYTQSFKLYNSGPCYGRPFNRTFSIYYLMEFSWCNMLQI